ncbi:hypothetical protein QIA30_05400 (plasmid) [Borreliella turdi]
MQFNPYKIDFAEKYRKKARNKFEQSYYRDIQNHNYLALC